jgi:hypothetical protein
MDIEVEFCPLFFGFLATFLSFRVYWGVLYKALGLLRFVGNDSKLLK